MAEYFWGQSNSTLWREEMQVCGRLRSVISGEGQRQTRQQRGRQRKSPRPRSNRQLAYLPPPLPPLGPTNGSQGKTLRVVLHKLPSPQKIQRRIGEAQFSAAATMSCNFLMQYSCVGIMQLQCLQNQQFPSSFCRSNFLTFFCHQHILR